MSSKIRLKRGTAAKWNEINPTLYKGEPGYETDTGKLKIGDGLTPWINLSYFAIESSPISDENLQDIIGDGFLVGGDGISIDYSDENNTLTISATGAANTGDITFVDAIISTANEDQDMTITTNGNGDIYIGADKNMIFDMNAFSAKGILIQDSQEDGYDDSGTPSILKVGSIYHQTGTMVIESDGAIFVSGVQVDHDGNPSENSVYGGLWLTNGQDTGFFVPATADSFYGSMNQNVEIHNNNNNWKFTQEGNLNLPEGKTLNFGQNIDTLGPPVEGGGTDRIRLWDFEGEGSNFNYAIGAEGNHVWFAMDVNNGTGGFKFYSRDNEIFKISDDSKLMFPNGTTVATGTFDNGTSGNNGISLNCAVGYELNWQGGRLKSTYNNGETAADIYIDSTLRLEGNSSSLILNSESITFPNGTTQTTAAINAAVPWTINHTLVDGTRYLANDVVYSDGNLYKANFDNESEPVTNATYWTNIGSAYRLNIDGRDIPNIPYPVEDIVQGTNITVSEVDGVYTINGPSAVQESASIITTVFNKTGSPIPKMTVVYITGGQGDMPTIGLAIGSAESTSSKTYGITAEAIGNMSTGKVIVQGALTGLNTDQWNPTAPTGNINGTILYLSPTVAGGITTTKPSAPNHMVSIGTVVRTHQNAGVIEVRIQNGFELQELHNVKINNVQNNDILAYNSATSLWENNNNIIFSNTSGIPGASSINNIVVISQTDYNELGTYDPSTLYIIT